MRRSLQRKRAELEKEEEKLTTQKLCPNCFQKGTYLGGRCRKCGYVKEDRPQCALPDDYVLGQHYAVGRVITQDDVMITYLGAGSAY